MRPPNFTLNPNPQRDLIWRQSLEGDRRRLMRPSAGALTDGPGVPMRRGRETTDLSPHRRAEEKPREGTAGGRPSARRKESPPQKLQRWGP